MRLAKFLAHAGVASRRAAEVIVADGRVTVAGEVVTDPARDVDETSGVALDGRPPVRVARGGDNPSRLVQRMNLVRLGRHWPAIERHATRLVNVARRIGNNLAVDRNAPVRDDRLSSTPRGDTRVGKELGEPHAPQRTGPWSPRAGGAEPAYGSGEGVADTGCAPI